MPHANGMASAQAARLEALKVKHLKLSKKIEDEQNHFSLDAGKIAYLKRQKLHLKEEIEGIRKAS
ncbi:MAG: DUF465 domain-containing protein [Pseudomonadota bacterium]